MDCGSLGNGRVRRLPLGLFGGTKQNLIRAIRVKTRKFSRNGILAFRIYSDSFAAAEPELLRVHAYASRRENRRPIVAPYARFIAFIYSAARQQRALENAPLPPACASAW